MIWLITNWRTVLFTILLGFAAAQTYRLQAATSKLAVLAEQETARIKAAQVEALHNTRNKERTDEQYQNDLRSARAAGVRDGRKRVFITYPSSPTASNTPTTICFDPEQLNAELTEWAGRVAQRLSGVAQQAEEVAAAYRACRAYVLEQN